MYSAIEDIIIYSIHEWYNSPSFEGNIREFESSLSSKSGFNISNTKISWIDNKAVIIITVDTYKTPTIFSVCVDSDNLLEVGEYTIDG